MGGFYLSYDVLRQERLADCAAGTKLLDIQNQFLLGVLHPSPSQGRQDCLFLSGNPEALTILIDVLSCQAGIAVLTADLLLAHLQR